MLLRLSAELQAKLYVLVHHPFLIIENLIMLEKITEVQLLFKEFPESRKNHLIFSYSLKALTFPFHSGQMRPEFSIEWNEKCKFEIPSNSKNDSTKNLLIRGKFH